LTTIKLGLDTSARLADLQLALLAEGRKERPQDIVAAVIRDITEAQAAGMCASYHRAWARTGGVEP
jgi:hypothetical protein